MSFLRSVLLLSLLSLVAVYGAQRAGRVAPPGPHLLVLTTHSGWIIDPIARTQGRLFRNDADSNGFAITDDGCAVALLQRADSSVSRLLIYDLAPPLNRVPRRVEFAGWSSGNPGLRWSPDDTRVAFVGPGEDAFRTTLTIVTRSGQLTRVELPTNRLNRVAWHADSRAITVYDSDARLYYDYSLAADGLIFTDGLPPRPSVDPAADDLAGAWPHPPPPQHEVHARLGAQHLLFTPRMALARPDTALLIGDTRTGALSPLLASSEEGLFWRLGVCAG